MASEIDALFTELQSASTQLDQLVAAFRERHEVVVRERAAAVSHLGYSSPRGTRLPLLPQFAPPFFAGVPAAEVKAWIKEFNPPCSKAQVDAFFAGVEFVREHGYLFSVVRRGADVDHQSTQWLSERRFDAPIVAQYDLVEKESYNVSFLSAPVYDGQRRVAFVLALVGFHQAFTGAEIEQIGTRVRDACTRITTFMAPPGTPAA